MWTAITPGMPAASLVSIELIVPCATDDLAKTTWTAPSSLGSVKSSMYTPPVVKNFGSSFRSTFSPSTLPATYEPPDRRTSKSARTLPSQVVGDGYAQAARSARGRGPDLRRGRRRRTWRHGGRGRRRRNRCRGRRRGWGSGRAGGGCCRRVGAHGDDPGDQAVGPPVR